MAKERKTKREKLRSSQRKEQSQGFVVDSKWLKKTVAKTETASMVVDKKYFKVDLTKTLILTMLVLALELALWQYLSRQ